MHGISENGIDIAYIRELKCPRMTNPAPLLSIVVPCYYEEEALPVTASVLGDLLQSMIQAGEIQEGSHCCFVNDGSQDGTWEIITSLVEKSNLYRGVNLSRNFGHQGALLAGLFTDSADAYISIDADLQDDEQKIREMVQLYRAGKDIVYGCREDRKSDTWFKRSTAQLFYKIRSSLGCQTIPNHADYRLMSARAVKELKRYGEVNLYLRGIVPMLGFPAARVYYSRKQRELGESKYPLIKMLRLAWNGVVNFSEVPLQVCIWFGLMGFLFSLALIAWCIYRWYIGAVLPGWTSTVLVVSAFGSMQFLFTGVIGLYIGKIFHETKNRPHFIVQDDLTRR